MFKRGDVVRIMALDCPRQRPDSREMMSKWQEYEVKSFAVTRSKKRDELGEEPLMFDLLVIDSDGLEKQKFTWWADTFPTFPNSNAIALVMNVTAPRLLVMPKSYREMLAPPLASEINRWAVELVDDGAINAYVWHDATGKFLVKSKPARSEERA